MTCDVTSSENKSGDDEQNFRKNVPKYAQKLEKPYQYLNIYKLKVLSFQSPMPDLFKTEIYGQEVKIRPLGLTGSQLSVESAVLAIVAV